MNSLYGRPSYKPLPHGVYYNYFHCDYHMGWGHNLRLITLKDPEKLGASKKWYGDGVFLACGLCISHFNIKKSEFVKMSFPTVEDVKVNRMITDETHRKLLGNIVELKSVFPGHIKDILLIPDEYIKNPKFKDALNICFRINGLCIDKYTSWAIREKKNLFNYWEEDEKKTKFWTVQLTKLLLSLSEIHHTSSRINIWVRGYSKLMSIELFTRTRMIETVPKKVYRIR